MFLVQSTECQIQLCLCFSSPFCDGQNYQKIQILITQRTYCSSTGKVFQESNTFPEILRIHKQ